MLFDRRELIIGQLSGFGQHLVRDVDLAHVVDRTCGTDQLCLRLRQLHSLRDHVRVARHSPRMAVGVRVSRLQGSGERREHLDLFLGSQFGAQCKAPATVHEPLHVGDVFLDAQATEQTPEHEIGEHDVPRAPVSHPQGGASRGSGNRQDGPHSEGQKE
jgi:hypothetical protein